MTNDNLGNRDQLKEWVGTKNWDGIDQAVDCQNQLKVAARFLSPYPLPGATSALRGIINPKTSPILSIQQSDSFPLIEIGVQFELTQAQVENEAQSPMGVTLANRAGTLLALAEDLVIFQGDKALLIDPFLSKTVDTDGSPAGIGLVNIPTGPPFVIPVFPVEVDPTDSNKNRYGENTFAAVAQAFALLQTLHYGRCALVLQTIVYADTYAALPTTLAVPAERIKRLVSEHFYPSSALPLHTGIVVAMDGDTMDLVVGQDPLTTYQNLSNNLHFFKLWERIGLRVNDPTAVVRLEFQLEFQTPGAEEQSRRRRTQ